MAQFDSLNNKLESKVLKVVKDDLSTRMHKYEKVTNDFAKFVDSYLLSKILDTKVDFKHLDKVIGLKVSYTEYEEQKGILDLLDKKI